MYNSEKEGTWTELCLLYVSEVLQALLAKWALEMADEKLRVFSFE